VTEKILKKINQFDNIIIIPHIRPDGDCLGSSFGLKHTIENLYANKKVHVIGNHSRDTQWMGEISEVTDELFKESLIISVDTGSLDRAIDKRILTGKYLIRIDHHPRVDFFGDIDYVNSDFPSTCTIITDIFRTSKIKIPVLAAECLFFGTITDTGRFKHRGVNANTHVNSAYLLETGMDSIKIFNYIYLKDINTLKLDKYVLNNFKFTKNGTLYLTITKDTIKKLNIDYEQAGNTISKLENIIDYPVWAVFYEIDEEIRGRIRSRGPIINEIAAKYRGGGHVLASGITLHHWNELEYILNDLDEVVSEYKNGMK